MGDKMTTKERIPDSMDELIDISLKRIQFTLHDEAIRKTRRILTMEQFRSERIARLATRYNLENIQGMYQKILQGMMEAGIIRSGDSAMLALSFVAPITLLIQMCDREPEREQEAMESIKMYLNHFAEEYLLNN